MTEKLIIPVGSLVIGLLFGLIMLLTYLLVKPPPPPAELIGVLRPQYRLLAPFHLETHNQGGLTEASLKGRWSFIFFGYLSCPDVCPNTLHELGVFRSLLMDEIAQEPQDLQVIFISVDPDRDSPEKLASYVQYFDKTFIAATAEKSDIKSLAGQFGADYVIETETARGQYLVSHTSAIFLTDPLGRLVANFSQPHYASTLLSQYQKITAYFTANS